MTKADLKRLHTVQLPLRDALKKHNKGHSTKVSSASGWVINCHKCTTLLGDATGEARATQERSIPSSQLCCEPKIAPKF
jgi:hypothetical protein